MTSRDDILSSIRKTLPQAMTLPDLSGNWIEYDDPVAQFVSVLESVGGECHFISNVSEIPPLLGDAISTDRTVVSCVPGLLEDRFDWTSVTDPHELAGIDLAILPGTVSVAENAAIWVDDEHVPFRVTFFLTQHLALVVPKSEVVHNMHQAYDRIKVAQRAFGTFISGPSKTADIEQSLVKGAHGARTLLVFMIDS